MRSSQIHTAVLKPIKETPEDLEAVEAIIKQVFRREIYLPLIRSAGKTIKTLHNAGKLSELIRAILSEKIGYHQGSFFGQIKASISRELKSLGAKWDKRSASWKIPKSQIPADINEAIFVAELKIKKQYLEVDKKLEKIIPEEISAKVRVSRHFEKTLNKIDRQLTRTIKPFIVAPKVSARSKELIAEEYTNNLQLYIKGWIEEEIPKLREEVQRSVFSGNRYENLAKTIVKSYGQSERKAKFLARQETSLMITKYKELRYSEVGVEEYIWTCVQGTSSHPVRPMHKALQGKIFRWDNPPVVNEKGQRLNPGQDFGCRCYAKPIVKFKRSE